jgi:uncharacterized membrane-anchored protein
MTSPARLVVLALACLAQLGLVVTSIADYEVTLAKGEPLRFALAPVDPADPFRGRYVALRFELEQLALPIPPGARWGGHAYLVLGTGEDGFAEARALQAAPPPDGPYLRVEVFGHYAPSASGGSPHEITRVGLPFDRYYTEESKAARIERLYAARPDPARTYAVVRVRGGRGVIESLVVDGEAL